MGIVLNIDNMHLFDAETNQSLAFEYKAAGVREAAMPV
jgi:hypothetical protein